MTIHEEQSARDAYRDALVELMAADPTIYCIDTDTGLFSGVDFGAAARRYVNLGIAEQNAVGVAAGLAASGKQPFVNTMAAFAGTRALEQVKIDVAYNRLPVRIVATHGGLSAGHLGPTHHALEDIATMRVLPNMTVVVPGDARQTRDAIRQASGVRGPVYVRLGRKPAPALPPSARAPFRLGAAEHLRAGGDAVAFACGAYPIAAALAAHDALGAEGIGLAVVNVHTVKPLDRDAIVAAARGRPVVTIEDHWAHGGLGGAIAELLSEIAPARVHRIGLPDAFAADAGDHPFLLERYGITADAVTRAVRSMLGGAR